MFIFSLLQVIDKLKAANSKLVKKVEELKNQLKLQQTDSSAQLAAKGFDNNDATTRQTNVQAGSPPGRISPNLPKPMTRLAGGGPFTSTPLRPQAAINNGSLRPPGAGGTGDQPGQNIGPPGRNMAGSLGCNLGLLGSNMTGLPCSNLGPPSAGPPSRPPTSMSKQPQAR